MDMIPLKYNFTNILTKAFIPYYHESPFLSYRSDWIEGHLSKIHHSCKSPSHKCWGRHSRNQKDNAKAYRMLEIWIIRCKKECLIILSFILLKWLYTSPSFKAAKDAWCDASINLSYLLLLFIYAIFFNSYIIGIIVWGSRSRTSWWFFLNNSCTFCHHYYKIFNSLSL